jgi:hypothetical protein
MERTLMLSRNNRAFGCTGLREGSLGINLHEGVDLGMKQSDTRQMRFDQFDWRDLLLANELCHADRGQKN